MLTVGVAAAVAAPSPKSTATITFTPSTTGGLHPSCTLRITSTKDISNYTVNGVKTEGITTSTVTLNVANGDMITVKSGTTRTPPFTVSGCLPADAPHGGGDPHHGGDPHDPTDGHDHFHH